MIWHIFQHSAIFGASLAALAALVALLLWVLLRHRKSPEEIERLRRLYLVQHGRIIDGTILDLTDPLGPGDARILQYKYEIAGVVYECGQDITHLYGKIALDGHCLGMPASVRYDPHHPGNSILVAETWSGLYNRPPQAAGAPGSSSVPAQGPQPAHKDAGR
jgi:hypothetical protein